MNRALKLLVLLWAGLALAQDTPHARPAKCTATGDLEIRDFKSTVFHNTRKLRVLLPAGYREAKNAQRKYSVLYLNDGQNIFDVCTCIFGPKEWRVDETVDRMVAEGQLPAMIVVGIDNAGRHEKDRAEIEKKTGSRPMEYLPYPDGDVLDVHGSDFPHFLLQEVMPFVEKHYRVKTGPQNTVLGGSSYGGLITFYVALHTSNIFGGVLIESPSFYVQDYAVLKEADQHRDWPARIYFGGGTEESPPDDPEPFPQTGIQKAVKVLQGDGVSQERIMVNLTPGQHDEDAWGSRLPKALSFLFPSK